MAGWFRRRREIWSKPRGTPSAEKFLPFDSWALHIYRLGFWLAPSWLFIDTARCFEIEGKTSSIQSQTIKRQKSVTALYVLFWFAVLIGIWLVSSDNDTVAKVGAGIALFRLFEIAITVLGFVLDQREPQIARSLITIGILGLQVALIFSIVGNAFAHNDFWMPGVAADENGPHPAADSPWEYLYLNSTYMITIGNAYTPATELARYLQVTATLSGIVLLGIVAARAIGLAGTTEQIVSDLKAKVGALEKETTQLKEEIDKRSPG
jgi:hypothetical protein